MSTCLIGQSGSFDVIAYARAMIEDATAPYVIPDASFLVLVEKTAEEYSRYLPLDETIGDPSTATSPLMTAPNVRSYVCTPGNGFAVPPMTITDVLYRAGATYSAANELAYLSILPFSPINRFLYSPNLLDSPSERILRNEYLNELQHYGKGFYAAYRDRATGLLSIMLFPTPTGTSVPVFVRYLAAHPKTGTTSDPIYATIPEDLKYPFGDLLYSNVMLIEADRLAKFQRARAGLLDIEGDPVAMRELAMEVRHNAIASLNGFQGVGQVSN